MRSGLRSSRAWLSSPSAPGVPTEMLVQRITPRGAGLRVAEGVELEDRAIDPELLQQLVGEGEQLDIRLWLAGADDLRVELVELAEAALLRPLVAERRSGSEATFKGAYCCQPSLR